MKVEISRAGDERIPFLGGYRNQRNCVCVCVGGGAEVIDLSCVLIVKALVAQSSPTLCDPIDCCLPGSTVHGILQARILAAAAAAKSLQLCPTLCDPIDGSPPGSAIPGIH